MAGAGLVGSAPCRVAVEPEAKADSAVRLAQGHGSHSEADELSCYQLLALAIMAIQAC